MDSPDQCAERKGEGELKRITQGLWGTETACQVGLSGIYDLDKWRGAGIFKSELG